jgi:hypothetical protein
MSTFYELSESSRDSFFHVFNKKTFPLNVRFQFIGSEKQKNLIKISKLSDQYLFILEKELLVSINENLIEKFDQESINILIEQEIDKISIDMDSGKIKMIKTDLNTFSSLINKYGVEKVARANQVEELYHQQQKDGKELIS